MKVLLEMPDNKAPYLMEILKSISFVKTKTISDTKARLISEFIDSIDEMLLVDAGKLKARNAEDFLNEL